MGYWGQMLVVMLTTIALDDVAYGDDFDLATGYERL